MNCLLVGDSDLYGSKFNGHDLHFYLQDRKINAYHAVCNKLSDDNNTICLDCSNHKNFFYSLLKNNNFYNADIVHLHLIHNTPFNINNLIFITTLKPTVWTLHDPWILGGHCIYSGDCIKWQQHCFDCPNLNIPFLRKNDTTALEFAIKKQVIQNSQIQAIVASQWMKDKVLYSPIWQGKKIYYVPFGINQALFKPKNIYEAKSTLGIASNTLVLFARIQTHFKGLNILQNALHHVALLTPFTLLTVGEKKLLNDLPKTIQHKEYGWINDDVELTKLYQACDIFLMPSEQEAFGMMAIEAMSCGKMVLALDTPASALSGIINAPYCGVVASKESYAQELVRLINAPHEILQRGKRCLDFAQRNYNSDIYINKIIDVYRSVIADFKPSENANLVLEQLKKYATQEAIPVIAEKNSYYERCKRYYRQHGMKKTFRKILELIFLKASEMVRP